MVLAGQLLVNDGRQDLPIATGQSGTDFRVADELAGKFYFDLGKEPANGRVIDEDVGTVEMILGVTVDYGELPSVTGDGGRTEGAEFLYVSPGSGQIGGVSLGEFLANSPCYSPTHGAETIAAMDNDIKSPCKGKGEEISIFRHPFVSLRSTRV